MPKEPLTPAGVEQKIADLYELPDDDLIEQANLLRADFRQWVKDNFELSTAQSDYLDDTDERWVKLSACQAAFAMENRLVIELIAEDSTGKSTASKLLRTKNKLIATTGQSGGFSAAGDVTFEIFYA